jgi:hypothetical protein
MNNGLQQMAFAHKPKQFSSNIKMKKGEKAASHGSAFVGKCCQCVRMIRWQSTQYRLHLLTVNRYQVRDCLANICFHFVTLIWRDYHLRKDMYHIRHKGKDL